MGESRIDRGVQRVLVGFLDAFQVGAQMVALRRDEAEFPVHIDGRGVHDLIAGGAQNRVGDFAFGHGTPGDCQRIGRRNLPLGVRHLRAALHQHILCCADTGLHILPCVFKDLFVGHIADGLPVHLHVEHKTDVQPVAHDHYQQNSRRHGQHIGQGIPRQRKILFDAAAQILPLGFAQLAGILYLKLILQLAHMPHARSHPLERTGQIRDKGQYPLCKGADDQQEQIPQRRRKRTDSHPYFPPGADQRIFDPKAD